MSAGSVHVSSFRDEFDVSLFVRTAESVVC